jgi:uncharacterized protein DUF4270
MKYNHSLKHVKWANAGIAALLFFFLGLFIVSCQEDPSYLGRNLLPPGDSFEVKSDLNTEIKAYSLETVPGGTSYNATYLLGSMKDDFFGFYKADFLTRFQLYSNYAIGNERILDSLVLKLKISNSYGDTLSVQTIRAFEMTDTLAFDSLYYSDFDPTGIYSAVEVGSANFTPLDSIINIPITNLDLLDRFATVDDSIFSDTENFLSFFNGLYITTDPVMSGGAISLIDISSSETEFVMYYRGVDDTASNSFKMRIYEGTPKVNMFSHDFTGARIDEQLNNVSSTDTLIFISGMNTAVAHLSFPGLENWLDSTNIVINKAELVVYVEDTLKTNLNSINYPSRIFLFSDYQKESSQLIYDYLVDSDSKSYYGGSFVEDEQAYYFNIGIQLQSYLRGDIESMDMIMVPSSNLTNVKQIILKSPLAKKNKMKLKIIYTHLD